jgi:hypothetical protein
MRSLLVGLTLLGLASPALSQTSIDGKTSIDGNITRIRTGWGADQFIIELNKLMVWGACTQKPAPGGYVSVSTTPGHALYFQAALAAYAKGRPVTVIVDTSNCALKLPLLIGINLL